MSVSRIEFEFVFGNIGFGGERTQEYPEKNLSEKRREPTTNFNPHMTSCSGNRTRYGRTWEASTFLLPRLIHDHRMKAGFLSYVEPLDSDYFPDVSCAVFRK